RDMDGIPRAGSSPGAGSELRTRASSRTRPPWSGRSIEECYPHSCTSWTTTSAAHTSLAAKPKCQNGCWFGTVEKDEGPDRRGLRYVLRVIRRLITKRA